MKRFPAPQASRQSYAKHRQDVTRQILLPMVLVSLLILAAAVLIAAAALTGGGDASKWAAVAAIWIVIPLMALMIVIMLLAWGVVYLLIRLLQVTPHYTGIAQAYALRFNDQILLWTDRIIQPILKVQAWLKFFSKEK